MRWEKMRIRWETVDKTVDKKIKQDDITLDL